MNPTPWPALATGLAPAAGLGEATLVWQAFRFKIVSLTIGMGGGLGLEFQSDFSTSILSNAQFRYQKVEIREPSSVTLPAPSKAKMRTKQWRVSRTHVQSKCDSRRRRSRVGAVMKPLTPGFNVSCCRAEFLSSLLIP